VAARSRDKFRTMVPEADERRSQLEGMNEMTGPVFKMRDDPRVTRVGRFSGGSAW